MFNVRSYDYLTSKIKIPSPESLYHLVAVEVYEKDRRIPNASSRIKLPDVPTDNPNWYCPEILIFYLSLPTEAPSLGFSSKLKSNNGLMQAVVMRMRGLVLYLFIC